jgi:hypothetical protein
MGKKHCYIRLFAKVRGKFSLEAGITRNALYQGHLELVEIIRTRLDPLKRSKPRKRGDIHKLRDENAELARRVASLLSQNAAAVPVSVAEKRLNEMSRARDKTHRDAAT